MPAMLLNSAPAMCAEEPLPNEAKLSLLGDFLASATRACGLEKLEVLAVTTTSCAWPNRATGMNLFGSYGMLLYIIPAV